MNPDQEQQPRHAAPVESDEKGFIPSPDNPDEGKVDRDVPDVAEAHDEEDVPQALARETQDGSGFESEDELPESDFQGFATDDVEVEDQ